MPGTPNEILLVTPVWNDSSRLAVFGETLARAEQLGLEPDEVLKRSDSYHFFAALGDLIKTGPTGTNVTDLSFIFVF